MDERLATDVFHFIRREVLKRGAGGPVHHAQVQAHFGDTVETDAALAVLLLDKRILAYQRDETWAYSLNNGGDILSRHEVLTLLAKANPEVRDLAETDQTVLDAATDYYRRNPPLFVTEGIAYHDGALGTTFAPGRSRFEGVEHVDIETDQHGGINIVRAR